MCWYISTHIQWIVQVVIVLLLLFIYLCVWDLTDVLVQAWLVITDTVLLTTFHVILWS